MKLYMICKSRRNRETGETKPATVVSKGHTLEYVREICNSPESSSDYSYNPRAKYDWFLFYVSMN